MVTPTYADHVLANGIKVADFFLFRRMDNDDGGSENTEKATDLTVKV